VAKKIRLINANFRSWSGKFGGDALTKTDKGVFIRPLRLSGVNIKRHKDDEQMLVSFAITMLDAEAEMHQLLHAVKKSPINIEITPPSKAAAKEAEDQLRLISREQAEDTAEEADNG